jgi:hypothetical protein
MDDSVAATDVINITGTTAELTGEAWVTLDSIKFAIPELPPNETNCFIGFQVNPKLARSYHNKAELDGNSNPNSTNG